jgi:hypothetical protein
MSRAKLGARANPLKERRFVDLLVLAGDIS